MSFEESVHNVTLTGNEISTILYCLEGYIQGNDDYNQGGNFSLDVDNIFSALESVCDNYEGEFTARDVQKCITNGTDYKECVDHLVDSMGSAN